MKSVTRKKSKKNKRKLTFFNFRLTYYSHITRQIFAVYATVDLISPFLVDMQF